MLRCNSVKNICLYLTTLLVFFGFVIIEKKNYYKKKNNFNPTFIFKNFFAKTPVNNHNSAVACMRLLRKMSSLVKELKLPQLAEENTFFKKVAKQENNFHY